MNYIAVDDEPFVLKDIIETIREAEPSCNLAGFTLPSLALEHVKKEVVDVAWILSWEASAALNWQSS